MRERVLRYLMKRNRQMMERESPWGLFKMSDETESPNEGARYMFNLEAELPDVLDVC